MLFPDEFEGPCDLCLPHESSLAPVKDRVARAFRLGYRTVAVEVRVRQDQLTTKKASAKRARKRAKTEDDGDMMTDFPAPPEVRLDDKDVDAGRRKILTRLTVEFSDNSFLPLFNRSATAARYDLLAVVPPSAAALTALLKTGFRADLVAFDADTCRDVRWTRKLYQECTGHGGVNGGMHFELPYASAIRDAGERRRLIAQSHTYHAAGRSRRVVLSSGARSAAELRSPRDVANLGFLFGLGEERGAAAVSAAPLDAVRNAAGRKMGAFRVVVQRVQDVKEEERWKVPDEAKEEGVDSGDDSSGDDEEVIAE